MELTRDMDWTPAHLGQPALLNLDTPVLVVDEGRLRKNIARMASQARALGVALRPHAKTHKSLTIARQQILSGATGITVATIGEAEVFSEGGILDLFIAYPLRVNRVKAERLRAVASRSRLRVSADSVEGAELLGAALGDMDVELLVEVDSGEHRTGVSGRTEVKRIIDLAASRGLQPVGAFTHGGHAYARPGAAHDVALQERDSLIMAAKAYADVGVDCTVLSAGSTPTALMAAQAPVTEIRPGTYVFNDRQQAALNSCVPQDIAVFVATTVVSRAQSHVVIDAGAKTLSKDRAPFLDGFGQVMGYPDASITRLYDHHGVIESANDALPRLGEVLLVAPNHVCPVVDLADELILASEAGNFRAARIDAHARSR